MTTVALLYSFKEYENIKMSCHLDFVCMCMCLLYAGEFIEFIEVSDMLDDISEASRE